MSMTSHPEPLIHIPLYCWQHAPDRPMRFMVQQLLTCLHSYFAHENTYDLLVTTNDRRPLEVAEREIAIRSSSTFLATDLRG